MILAKVDPATLFAIGVLLMVVVALRWILRRKRSVAPYHSPLEMTSGMAKGHMLDAPEHVGQWEVQMHETARDLMGQLNTKIVIVERLIADAHTAAERLEQAVEEARNARV